MSLLDDARKKNAKPSGGKAGPGKESRVGQPVDPYIPFPTHLLARPIRPFVREAALSIGCDEAFVGVPALVACAAAIGNTRRIGVKEDWTEPAVIWAALVGESGSRKSPPFRMALQPLVMAEQRYRQEYRVRAKRYRDARTRTTRRTRRRAPAS